MNKIMTVFDAFDGGYDIIADMPRLTVIGKEKIYVENFLSLLEYKKENIKLKCKTCVLEIKGSDFTIKTIRENCVEVHGKTESVNFV